MSPFDPLVLISQSSAAKRPKRIVHSLGMDEDQLGPVGSLPQSAASTSSSFRHGESHAGDQHIPVTPHALSCIPRPIIEPVLHKALQVFLSDTVLPVASTAVTRGHFATLPQLVESSSSTDPLRCALQAVALASLARRLRAVNIAEEALSMYTLCLQRVSSINLNDQSDTQKVIACIILMSVYEV